MTSILPLLPTLLGGLVLSPQVTPRDEAQVTAAVVQYVLRPGQRFGQKAAAQRPLFIGLRETEAAFAKASGRASRLDLASALPIPFAPMARTEATVCDKLPRTAVGCTIRDEGLWLAVHDVKWTGADDVQVTIEAAWAGPLIRGRPKTDAFLREVLLRRTPDGWRVVGEGRTFTT